MTSRDIVAAEAYYHHSCYKNYKKFKNHKDVREGSNELKEAYVSLFKNIITDIILNKKFVQVTSFTEKLKSFLPSG